MTPRILSLVLAAAVLGACSESSEPALVDLSSFEVTVSAAYSVAGGTRTPVPASTECTLRYRTQGLPDGTPLGATAEVPVELRGTKDCPYVIPRGEVELDVGITAIDRSGKPLSAFSGPVSFRLVPGKLSESNAYRWTTLTNGTGAGTVRGAHLFSEVRVWVEDAPVTPGLSDGGTESALPEEPKRRSYATGLSPSLFFEEVTIAKVQLPDLLDNRDSPLVGQFLTIGRAPENGEPIRQSCERAPDGGVYPEDGQPAKLVVTGMDPGGFFVTDATACPSPELLEDSEGSKVGVPEPSGMNPGRFGSMYIYNYSFPEGLDQGDVLWAVAGAVQEFSSTTQLIFPSWIIREKARERPEPEWLRHLADIPPVDLNLRHCGLFDKMEPFITDVLCGQNRRNLKLESLESALVRVRHARVPEVFTTCDRDGDSKVPFFCEGAPGAGWGHCDPNIPWDPTLPENAETACNIDCVTGQGEYAGKRCSERVTFSTFGQFVIEMNGPGPEEAGLDPALPKRLLTVPVGAASSATATALPEGVQLRIWCDTAARMKVGALGVTAAATDERVPARTLVERQLVTGETYVAFIQDGSASGTCTVAPNPRTRINLVTKDALPQLEPDCSIDPALVGETRARECVNFRGATYDIVGHLRQVQAARPRWVLLPRDADDVCCHAGVGLECPTSIKPCP